MPKTRTFSSHGLDETWSVGENPTRVISFQVEKLGTIGAYNSKTLYEPLEGYLITRKSPMLVVAVYLDEDILLDLGDGRQVRVTLKETKLVGEGRVMGRIGIHAPDSVKIQFPKRKRRTQNAKASNTISWNGTSNYSRR